MSQVDLDILGFGKTKFVMDRGFYSEDNINGLYRDHIKFLVGTKLSLKFIRKHLDEVYDDIRMFVNFDESINTYGYTVSAQWEYTQERPYKGDVIKDKRRMYIHYYFSIENGADDEQAFDKRPDLPVNVLPFLNLVYFPQAYGNKMVSQILRQTPAGGSTAEVDHLPCFYHTGSEQAFQSNWKCWYCHKILTKASTPMDIRSAPSGSIPRSVRTKVMSSKINAGCTSITITALKMVLTMSRHSTNELPAFAKNCQKANMLKAIKRPMTSSLK